jgi:hypothetical protein
MTNGDKIRAMTDEELSDFLGGIADNCSYNTCDNCPMYGACADVPLSRDKWLREEATSDENGESISELFSYCPACGRKIVGFYTSEEEGDYECEEI